MLAYGLSLASTHAWYVFTTDYTIAACRSGQQLVGCMTLFLVNLPGGMIPANIGQKEQKTLDPHVLTSASWRHPEQAEGSRCGDGPREQGARHRELPGACEGTQLTRRPSCKVK